MADVRRDVLADHLFCGPIAFGTSLVWLLYLVREVRILPELRVHQLALIGHYVAWPIGRAL